jgi:hypothetical protein
VSNYDNLTHKISIDWSTLVATDGGLSAVGYEWVPVTKAKRPRPKYRTGWKSTRGEWRWSAGRYREYGLRHVPLLRRELRHLSEDVEYTRDEEGCIDGATYSFPQPHAFWRYRTPHDRRASGEHEWIPALRRTVRGVTEESLVHNGRVKNLVHNGKRKRCLK